MSIKQISEAEVNSEYELILELAQMTDALARVTAERDRLSALADKWNLECDEMREDNKRLAAELKSLRDSRVELPFVTMCQADYQGNLVDYFTESQLRDYGDRRAMAERERCAKICDERAAKYLDRSAHNQHSHGAGLGATICAEAIRKGEQ